MHNKGFIMIELIISLAILVIISLLIGTSLNTLLNKNRQNDYEYFVNRITSSADIYLSNNLPLISSLYLNRGFVMIEIKDLIEEGLLESEMINPNTGEIVAEDELVMVSLDASGLEIFTYPAPTIKGDYLQTINKMIEFGDEFTPFIDLDTINLGYIDKDGYLVHNYFKNNMDNIECLTDSIDTNKLGTYLVKYNYITPTGVTKQATRNFIVFDTIAPRIDNITFNPINWTNKDVIIMAEIWDEESNIASYAINKDSCADFIQTVSHSISGLATSNGIWYVCAKDNAGNVTEKIVEITNVDKNPPVIDNVAKSTNNFVSSLIIGAKLNDNESGLIAYAINQTSNESLVNWISIANTQTKDVSQSVSANGTYYFWAKDLAGNITYRSINISNIGILKTASISSGEISSSTYNGSYNAGNNVKAIISVTTNNGTVKSYTASGNTINFTVSNGNTNNGIKNSICTKPAQYNPQISSAASLIAPSSSSFCRYVFSASTLYGPKYICLVETTATLRYSSCSNGRPYDLKYAGDLSSDCSGKCNRPCPGGGSAPILTAPNRDTCTSCTGTSGGRCTRYWKSSCTAYGKYTCPSGQTLNGTKCIKNAYYSCSLGWNLSNTTCSKSCQVSYTYYQYTINLQYYI